MNEVTVQIECNKDTGQYLVGIVPEEQEGQGDAQAQGGEEEAEKSYLKPVKSVDEALQVARDLLEGTNGDQAQAASAETDMAKGFAGPGPGGY